MDCHRGPCRGAQAFERLNSEGKYDETLDPGNHNSTATIQVKIVLASEGAHDVLGERALLHVHPVRVPWHFSGAALVRLWPLNQTSMNETAMLG